jgi:hypothetical protein
MIQIQNRVIFNPEPDWLVQILALAQKWQKSFRYEAVRLGLETGTAHHERDRLTARSSDASSRSSDVAQTRRNLRLFGPPRRNHSRGNRRTRHSQPRTEQHHHPESKDECPNNVSSNHLPEFYIHAGR